MGKRTFRLALHLSRLCSRVTDTLQSELQRRGQKLPHQCGRRGVTQAGVETHPLRYFSPFIVFFSSSTL